MKRVKELVGETVTADQLRNVDCYIGQRMGLFIPSVGYCGYAVTARHTHPTYSYVVFPTSARGVISFTACARPGEYEAAMLPPRIPHEEKTGDSFVRYFAFFVSTELTEKLYKVYGGTCRLAVERKNWENGIWSGFSVPKTIMQLTYRYMEACGETEGSAVLEKGEASSLVQDALETLIVSELIRSQMAQAAAAGETVKNPALYKAIDYLHQNYHKPVSVGQLAALCAMGESTFTRRFKEETGLTPTAYLVRLRLRKARKLILSSACSMTETALQCGFSSAAHFTFSFKKEFGLSPTEYRDRWMGGADS